MTSHTPASTRIDTRTPYMTLIVSDDSNQSHLRTGHGKRRADLGGGEQQCPQYKSTRSRIGLVPQEMAAEMYEKVIATVNFSRGLFGKRADAAYIEKLLRDLSLWDKRDAKVMELSDRKSTRLNSSH